MNSFRDGYNYIIVSPVKDEDKYIEYTIQSVIEQTIMPGKWIIVDDGSRDRTSEIIANYSNRYKWIQTLKLRRNSQRQPGSAVIHAFNWGYKIVDNENFDFIVKLDCDLRFGADYFERLIKEFHEESRLGIASGAYLERHGESWASVKMPDYHAAGASKVIRKKCFKEIGGFMPAKGWDTIDEIKAQIKGWKTCHFPELRFYHLKHEGSGIGFCQTNVMLGEIYYRTGGSMLFFILKVMHRMLYGRPFIISGIMMLYGFMKQLVLRGKLLVSEEEARFYRRLLNRRIISRFTIGNREI